ncbi:hypothetical protein [Scytonema sp. PCC 10023]|uniref:hypothetical protein n=1 Tax=Scytonema sp. PCC 10023 TaxID=1680591 RepID=UPI0039C71B55
MSTSLVDEWIHSLPEPRKENITTPFIVAPIKEGVPRFYPAIHLMTPLTGK